MATVYVIHAPADRAFVDSTLLKPLPSLGFDRWISSDDAASGGTAAAAIAACAAVIVVVSKASQGSEVVRRGAEAGMKAPTPVVPVQIDQTDPETVAHGLGALPKIEPGDEITRAAVPLENRVRTGLPQLLPPVAPAAKAPSPDAGQAIPWNEDTFSESLADAMTRLDFNRGDSLLKILGAHLEQRRSAYPVANARNDLKTLRRKRQFRLMEQYAKMVLNSGTDDLQVRRQLGQSLIERGQFEEALEVLDGIVKTAPPGDGEAIEATGLIGRLFKQRYVNNSKDSSAPDWLKRSFDEYYSVFRDGPDNFWHGVNAASVELRAARDGMRWASPDQAKDIANKILKRWDELKAENKIYVWDYASRVESLLTVGRFNEAETALDEYLTHPDMDAFEVSSTFRQFDEVLQLERVREAGPVYDKLWRTVDRFRAGGATSTPPQRVDVKEPSLLPILVRVSDPRWEPGEYQGKLIISARLGTVISARATASAIQALMKDSEVLSIEESRAVVDVNTNECDRGLPFIRCEVNANYTDTVGQFQEKGSNALIAFIDDGIDVLHQAFTDQAGNTRIVGIWDQRDDTGPPPPGFTYGTYHTQPVIDGYLRTNTVPVTLGRNVDGHGTHVASIAAGRKVGAKFYGGVAPEAQLVSVIAKSDGDIGYSTAHLEALVFIDAEAKRLKKPVVVNVSKGMNAGAHDGKSALEVAFDEFAGGGRKPGRVVVKSAGNERNKRGHATFSISPNTRYSLKWTRQPQRYKFERLELWWNAKEALTFKLASPSNVWSSVVNDATPDVSGSLQGGGEFHMQLIKRHPDNGDSLLRIELGDAVTGVTPGLWQLDIVVAPSPAGSGKPLHAWLARGGGNPSEFTVGDEKMTLTIPGTAQSVITVGAIEADNPPSVGEFSSFGPTRDNRDKPDVVAPGVRVNAARGGTADDIRPDDGTSMAAPHVAGAIALVLSRAVAAGRKPPAANQIASALTQKTKDYNGHFDPAQGYGVIDVAALLAAF